MTEIQTRCRGCKKRPRNCLCYEFRLELKNGQAMLFVDNVATEPVRGYEVRTWQTRRNSKTWRRPIYIDGFGPVLYTRDETIIAQIKKEIRKGKFHVLNYKGREGVQFAKYERSLVRTLPFLRKPRSKRKDSGAESRRAA